MRRTDLPMLDRWLQQPHVREWWRGEPEDLAAVGEKYGPCIDGGDPTELFVIEADDGRPVGMIQRFLFADEPEWSVALADLVDVSDAAGVDYLVGEPAAVGRGIGTAAIAEMTGLIFQWRPVTSIVVTVQQANPASWRALEKAGFRRVGAGEFESSDPSDDGPQFVYVIERVNRIRT
jgi:aminoglycoside 6'-N-acetyltransferase